MARAAILLGEALVVLAIVAAPARAQIGTLVSPGPLAKAHAAIEGASNCEKCHEPGRRVTAERCLACHKPVAERIRAGKGVHRGVTECASCHTEHAGRAGDILHFTPKGFNHAGVTGFALDGKHSGLACNACHKTRSYLGLQTACVSCHADPHKGRFGLDCAHCHSVAVAFKQATNFDHNVTKFPLTGAHKTVQCAKCHVNNVFSGLKFTLCTDCHKSPHRRPLGDNCSSCHTTETWWTQKIDHSKTEYPLIGKHATVPCASCHVKPAVAVRVKFAKCADCHSDPHKGLFKQDCASCHKETGFGKTPFDHSTTKFPLTGKHADIECRACHKNLPVSMIPAPTSAKRQQPVQPMQAFDFRGLSVECVSCHFDVHRGDAGTRCETCHATTAFRPVTAFKHPRLPEFFGGQHSLVDCAGCHRKGRAPDAPQIQKISFERALGSPQDQKPQNVPLEGWQFKNVPTACAACHKDPHLGQVGTACENCHSISAPKFAVVNFDHAKTGYPLTGKHLNVKCEQCHKSETGVFPAGRGTAVRLKGMSFACASCHTDPHLGQVGKTCENCHTTAAFQMSGYKHKGPAAQVVAGPVHAKLVCADCHKKVQGTFPSGNGVAVRYTGMGTQCSACHTDPHKGGLGPACSSCHSMNAKWSSATRNFHLATNFPLTGKHLSVECAQCHLNGVTKGTPTACYDCHWVRRHDDRYMTRLGPNCQDCHRTTSWTAVSWDHGAATGMALSGVHRALGCEGCHTNRQFVNLGRTCYSCHAADYNATTNPNHVAAHFPTTCDTCHSASANNWNASFNHNQFFALVGVHATLQCASCHANGVFSGTPTTCYGCHQADYNGTTNPNHAAAGFPTACDQCHQPSAPNWNTSFNHSTFFQLVGVHATIPCAQCHVNNNFTTVPTTCYGCHQADYNRTTDPNHAAAGFPTTCDQCHQASAPNWNASFNHSQFFALVGVHATIQCVACHTNNNYTTVPTICYGCHAADYNSTTDPNHAAAGFPTDCTQCHRATDTSWTQGTFNHTQFPITSGPHSGRACSACHPNAASFAVFQCTTSCHPQASTANDHNGVTGYVYNSAACYSCHPTGRGGVPNPAPRLAVSHLSLAPARVSLLATAQNAVNGAMSALRCVPSHARALR